MAYLDEIASIAALRAGFQSAARRRGGPGADGVTLAQFAAGAEAEFEQLRAELLAGTYRPRAARLVRLPKPGGGYRPLAISCVRDRIVQHSLATTLAAKLDHRLHPSAFAYRRGRSAQQALAAVDDALGRGLHWVLRADIEQFFDRIPPPLLLARVEAETHEPELVQLVAVLLAAGVLSGGEIADTHLGTPQGSPASPFLANLYLTPFDEAVAAAGFAMVRYADDFCIPVATRGDADAALVLIRRELAALELQLNPQKVEIRHLGEGFVFLGFQFTMGGRKAGPKARRQLVERIDAVLAERPLDAQEEIDELLRGWLGYYGSLGGIELPEAVRERAAALEAARVEAAQVGGVGTAPTQRVGDEQAETRAAPAWNESRWGRAALALVATGGDSGSQEHLRAELGIDAIAWPALAEALARLAGAEAAEILAGLGRFGDAAEAAEIAAESPVVVAAVGDVPTAALPADGVERPRLSPDRNHAQQLLDLFGGAEHVFFREFRDDERVRTERVAEPLTVTHVVGHLEGACRVGVFPLRANHSVRFAALRVLLSSKARQRLGSEVPAPPAVAGFTRRLRQVAIELGLEVAVSVDPRRGFVLWLPFVEALGGAKARALVRCVVERAGQLPPDVISEAIPAQDVAKPDKPGTGILLPLGLDVRSGERSWLCDSDLQPLVDQDRALMGIGKSDVVRIDAALRGDRLSDEAVSPLQEHPRAQAVYAGCNVLRHFVDKAVRGEGLASTERHFVTDVLGRLGDEAEAALDTVFRHLIDFRVGMASRTLARLYPYPTSCGRIREKMPELTARVGCDCRFRLVPGSYPTPALHAVGAAEIPGLEERVRRASERGGLARAAQQAMNAGHKDIGARAAALAARLADLRRQARALDRSIATAEVQLDAMLDQAGGEPIETPSGTLRRIVDGEVRRFIVEI